MFDITRKQDLYKTPKKEIIKIRKAFYDLKRRKNEPTDKWLKRVQKCIDCCDFPIFMEFLLIDRFVCGLSKAEIEIILKTETWSLEQLLENFLNRNGGEDKDEKPKPNVSAQPLDSESVSYLK